MYEYQEVQNEQYKNIQKDLYGDHGDGSDLHHDRLQLCG